MKSILQLTQIINFDFNIVKLQCYVGVDDPYTNVLVLLLVIPMLAVGGAGLAAILARLKGTSFNWPNYLNVVGLAFLVLYLSICIALTRPIHCRSNPNGLQTMVSSPAVVCWEAEHVGLALLAIGGLLIYGIGFIAYVAQIVWRHPALVDSGHGMRLLTQYHFLFNRFRGGVVNPSLHGCLTMCNFL